MSSAIISNHDEQSRKKRRKIDDSTSTSSSVTDQIRWSTSVAQQTYSSKLIDALRRVRRRTTATPSMSGGRAVREAADTVLATAAKGRTQWSRAILTNRLKRRLKNRKTAKTRSKIPSPPPKTAAMTAEKATATAPVDKRVKVLGRLVPGCRKLSFPNLLEETTDYIAALQMQVRAMAALAELLSGSSSSPAGATPSTGVEPFDSSHIHDHDDNPVH